MVDLVIARYNEDIYWTRDFRQRARIVIYNKSGSFLYSDFYTSENLLNMGREAHTYLYHICTRWNNLADWTVFSQGKYIDHITTEQFSSLLIPRAGAVGGNPCLCAPCLCTGNLKTLKDFENWAQKYLGIEVQPTREYMVWIGGFFGVSKERITRHGLRFYQDLLESIPPEEYPAEAFYMEWAWSQIFQYWESK